MVKILRTSIQSVSKHVESMSDFC